MSDPTDPAYVFRLEDTQYAEPVDEWDIPLGPSRLFVECTKYEILSRTPCGVWISYGFGKKFVRYGATKQWAFPNKDDAVKSFIARKRRQCQILDDRLNRAKRAMAKAQSDNPIGECPLYP